MLRTGFAVLGGSALLLAVLLFFGETDTGRAVVLCIDVVISLVGWWLVARGWRSAAFYSLLGGVSVLAASRLSTSDAGLGGSIAAAGFITVFATLGLGRKVGTALGALTAIVCVAAHGLSMFRDATPAGLADLVFTIGMLALFVATVSLGIGRQDNQLLERTRRLARVDTFLEGLMDSLYRVAAASTEIQVMASQHKQGALQQASAVSETREALASMLDASHKVARSAELVLANAQSTLANSSQVAHKVDALSRSTERIAETVEGIKGFANQSELLALNAALEGTKAGEAGMGFSLVAARLQGLSETILDSLASIRTLTEEIWDSVDETRVSIDAATRLAGDTTDAAREIALITRQHKGGTEQVVTTMGDIEEVTQQVAAGSQDILESIEELRKVAGELPLALEKVLAAETDSSR